MKLFIQKHLKIIVPIVSLLGMSAAFFGDIWALITVVAFVFNIFVAQMLGPEPYTPSDGELWYPAKHIVIDLLPEFETMMFSIGYAKKDYELNRNDCSIYTHAGIAVMHTLLLEYCPAGYGARIDPFGFPKDEGGRHRLFLVTVSGGSTLAIDTYPIFDDKHDETGMIRTLSDDEFAKGRIIS